MTLWLLRLGMKIAIADVDAERLNNTGRELAETIDAQNVLVIPTDVSDLDQVVNLKEKVYDTWGEASSKPYFTLVVAKDMA